MTVYCSCPPMHTCPAHGIKGNRKERAALRRESIKQQIRNAFLKGVKAQRLADKPWCENCGTESHETQLDLHHLIKRSHGNRYDGAEYGVDRPQNLSLLCRKCHDLLESRPEWTKTPDDDRR